MALIVQKYGGTSVGSIDRIRNVAARMKRTRDEGNQVVAVVSAVFFHFGEAHLSREAHKNAAQRLMQDHAAREPLFQFGEGGGDGALSFYAGKVVPVLSSSRLAERLAQHAPLWIVTEGNAVPVVPAGVEVVREAEVDDLVLLRLARP